MKWNERTRTFSWFFEPKMLQIIQYDQNCAEFFSRSLFVPSSGIISICECDLLYACIRNTSCSACQITMNEANETNEKKNGFCLDILRLYAR